MINLEELASARARALGQSENDWVKQLESDTVEKTVSWMSDGEIQELFSCAGSPAAFLAICEGIAQANSSGIESPFQAWKDHFAELEIGIVEGAELWHRAWAVHRDFSKSLQSIQRPALVAPAAAAQKKRR